MGGGLSSLKIYNAGSGTITAGQIQLTIYKQGQTADNVANAGVSWFKRLFRQNPSRYNSFNINH
jgi:hypothetical protein